MTRPPAILHSLVTRESLPIWLAEHGLTGNAVEIGTFRGEFSAFWLHNWPGHLTTIDPFENDLAGYRDGCVEGLDMEAVMQEAVARLHPWLTGGRCRLVKALSVDVAATIPDGSLDCVYCDGDHSGEAVAADIRAWWPKLKDCGLLGGHDCYERHDALQECGVFNAVLDFCEQIGVRPHVTPCTSWWVIKL